MSQTHRVLVVLPEASAAQGLARLQRAHQVLAVLRPRIAVLQLDDDAMAELGRNPDVVGAYVRVVPPEVVARLRPDERLFVEAWIQQQASEGKTRRGEGLSWDAPGFTPPGPPTRERP